MAQRPRLRRLADRLGILPSYLDVRDRRRFTSDKTRVALLAAMGVDASDEASAARSLRALAEEESRELDPVRVVRAMEAGGSIRLRVKGWRGAVQWGITLEEEGGGVLRKEGKGTAGRGELRIPMPGRPGTGYHVLRVALRAASREHEVDQTLIVAPSSCPRAAGLIGSHRVFGIAANLYALRSEGNWGAGDLSDLRSLVAWGAKIGAAFVGVNPLHTLRNRAFSVSPYSPVSRLFRNPLYLDIGSVPELEQSPHARALADAPASREAIAALRRADRLDYERVMACKRPVIEALHRAFAASHRGRNTERGRAYRRYVASEGEALEDFATWMAIDEEIARRSGIPRDWRDWPTAYQDPRSPAVADFREAHPEEVDLHRYVQFELDRQLETAAREARKGAMAIGVYQDLALGTAPDGCDPWAFPGLFVDGAALGAPPDDYSRTGQNWGLPPMDPRALAADRYRYWIRLIRTALAHAGALRIDHVMGLFRQFWVPRGRTAGQGAYVRYPARDLLGILAIESARAGALVIGEDLGTVPRALPTVLARWGILSSRVLYFEKQRAGGYRPASHYSRRALVSANTHDHPPIEGFLRGRDLALRREAGAIATDEALARSLGERSKDRRRLARRLASEGLLPEGAKADAAALRAAIHAFLSRTPSALLAVSLDDLVGEEDPVNLPGVPPQRYPNWTRRQKLTLEEIARDPGVARGLQALKDRRARLRPRAPARWRLAEDLA